MRVYAVIWDTSEVRELIAIFSSRESALALATQNWNHSIEGVEIDTIPGDGETEYIRNPLHDEFSCWQEWHDAQPAVKD